MTPAEELLRELQRHRAADATEQQHLDAITALVEEAALDALHRSHFVPGHITASAYIFDPTTERLLLHHHRRLDRWLQMGGHLEPGETSRHAALREGREESGIDELRFLHDGVFDVDVHFIPAGKGEPEHRHFDVRYLVAPLGAVEVRLDPSESVDLRWFDLDEAERRIDEEAGARVIRKIRGASLRDAS